MLGLVFGGGAAKGYAHIGALKVLEEKGIKPDIIVGASMGALVGGFYAAGFDVEKLEEIATKVDKKTKRWLFAPRLSKRGFIDGRNVVKHLSQYLGPKQIEDLPITYAAVATDIENDAEIVIDRGNLVQAIRASISIPVVFMPHRYAGRLLIDGGFVNPLPISVAQKLGAKKIIAVNVLRKIDYPRFEISPVSSPHKSYNMKQVFLETFELIISRLIDYEVRHMKNGIVVNINTKGIGMSQFEAAKKAIDRGYEETKNVDFKKALS
jgi:predicted acylesterase/phospholipase RssA